jgi:hypothetical protein
VRTSFQYQLQSGGVPPHSKTLRRDSREASWSAAMFRRSRGLTILEMLVSTAMLSFIVLGLTAMLIQTQKAFKTSIKAATVTDAGRTIMDMIGSDMRQMTDAQNIGVTNLCWSWSQSGALYQVDAIYVLEHTNTTWLGVGYAVKNLLPASTSNFLGSLYRFETNYNRPYIVTNSPDSDPLIWSFLEDVTTQNFSNQLSWHRVADGVIGLKLRAFDQNGNEPWIESMYYGDYAPKAEMSYPLSSNTLPNAVDVELAILEPDAVTQARALARVPSSTPLNNFMTNAQTMMEIFRRRVSIPIVAR